MLSVIIFEFFMDCHAIFKWLAMTSKLIPTNSPTTTSKAQNQHFKKLNFTLKNSLFDKIIPVKAYQ